MQIGHRNRIASPRLAIVAVFTMAAAPALADVFIWEYIDPLNPNLGKKQSTTLAPGGAGVNLTSLTALRDRNLTKAYLYQTVIPGYVVRNTVLDDAYLAEANLFNISGDSFSARGADLSRANLKSARLDGADFTTARFTAADLTGASLESALLSGADFTDAIVVDTDFNATIANGFNAAQLYSTASYQAHTLGRIEFADNDLSTWNFAGQSMIGGRFDSAILTGAQFDNAIIKDAIFRGSNLTPAQLYSTASYIAGALGQIDFTGDNLSGWDFSGQSMVLAELINTNIDYTTFAGADLTNARMGERFRTYERTNFQGAKLALVRFELNTNFHEADFREADLRDADLDSVGLVDSLFDDALIEGAKFEVRALGFTRANLYSTASYKTKELSRVELTRSELDGAQFSGFNLSGSVFTFSSLQNADFRDANLTDAFFGAAILNNADFRGANLTRAHLKANGLQGTQFQGANLEDAFFGDADLRLADLTDAMIRGAQFYDAAPAQFTREQLYSTASYKAGDLRGVLLSGDFRGWNFQDQDLRGARFERDSRLEGALWEGATLTDTTFFVNTLQNTDFTSSDVRGTQFIASNLDGADFRGNDLTGTVFRESSLAGALFDGVQLDGGIIDRANLTNARFVGADLRNARIFNNTYSNTDFTNADIRGIELTYATSQGFTIANLMSTKSYQDRDLAGVNFEGNALIGVDFSGFDFSGANLRLSNLTNVSFVSANLTGVNFRAATLTGADFTDAVLRRADLSGAPGNGFIALQLYSTRSYQEKELEGIHLDNSDLAGWNFSGMNLKDANFTSSNLLGASLGGATIKGANFGFLDGAGLTLAQLTSTASYQQKDLSGVGLAGANLTGLDLTQQDLRSADFGEARLSSVDFTDAWIQGASFRATTFNGFTPQQLYSTASYKSRDLRGVDLSANNLFAWDFRDQNLIEANLGNGSANAPSFLDRADLRGAAIGFAYLNASSKFNTILPDGTVHGLSLGRGQTLLIRNHEPLSAENGSFAGQISALASDPIAIVVDTAFAMSSGALKVELTDQEWVSTISFAENTPVTLGGVLELFFAAGVDPKAQVGRSFALFDWTGVSPIGQFQQIKSSSASGMLLEWDLSSLYTSGIVELRAVVPEPSLGILLTGIAAWASFCIRPRRVAFQS